MSRNRVEKLDSATVLREVLSSDEANTTRLTKRIERLLETSIAPAPIRSKDAPTSITAIDSRSPVKHRFQ